MVRSVVVANMNHSNSTLGYQSEFGTLTTIPTFSAYNFLRNCNYFLENPSQDVHLKAYRDTTLNYKSTNHDSILTHQENDNAVDDLLPKNLFSRVNLLSYPHPLQLLHRESTDATSSVDSSMHNNFGGYKKHRSEKKPIPDEQKDDKYFERRRRNNQAAKKSRDARKMREDQIALKATLLEHENALLRAQVVTLREEASTLRQMLLHRKEFEVSTTERQLCVITQ